MTATATATKSVPSKVTHKSDNTNVPVTMPVNAVTIPVFPMNMPGTDLEAKLAALHAEIAAVQKAKFDQDEATRNTIRAEIAVIQAELDPLVLARDEARRQYDALSSKCASKQADINLLLENSVFPQTSKASRGKGQQIEGERDRNGVLLMKLPEGGDKLDRLGRKLVDRRSLRHEVEKNPAIANQYDDNALLAGF